MKRAIAVLVLVAAVAVGCKNDRPGPLPEPTPTAVVLPTATPAPDPDAAVCYVADVSRGTPPVCKNATGGLVTCPADMSPLPPCD